MIRPLFLLVLLVIVIVVCYRMFVQKRKNDIGNKHDDLV